NEDIIINPYYMKKHDIRALSLNHFKLNNRVKILGEKKQKFHMIKFVIRTVSAFKYDLISWKILKKKPLGEEKYRKRAVRGVYYTFTSITDFGFVQSKAKNKYVFGCYQCEKNFVDIADIIKKEFEIVTPPSKSNLKMLNMITSSNAVCLHIRRGDYLNERWKMLQVCDFNYYDRAIQYMIDKLENPVFYLFSNGSADIKWIKENYVFSENPKIIYVDLNNPDYEELRLMTNCKHYIISNSTFSWWGAYLSQNKKKIVVAPSIWNKSLPEDKKLYGKDWTLIDVSE
ncbi:alpha-1,2-fucosyltransferase, partial [Bacillaceae bacterium Marseille-Q3522]|nr:alpha-1,2-fucosyltransferase [Bacillaceae bacterium Marseille-Q3522]